MGKPGRPLESACSLQQSSNIYALSTIPPRGILSTIHQFHQAFSSAKDLAMQDSDQTAQARNPFGQQSIPTKELVGQSLTLQDLDQTRSSGPQSDSDRGNT